MEIINKEIKGIYFCENCKKMHLNFSNFKKFNKNLLSYFESNFNYEKCILFFYIKKEYIYCLLKNKYIFVTNVIDNNNGKYEIFNIYNLKNNLEIRNNVFYFIELEFKIKDLILKGKKISNIFLIKLKQIESKEGLWFNIFLINKKNQLINKKNQLIKFGELKLNIIDGILYLNEYSFIRVIYCSYI